MATTKEKASPVAGKEDESIADLIADASSSSMRAICKMITIPLLISARCLNGVATTVERVCRDMQSDGDEGGR